MKLLEKKERKEFVRILIGKAETGSKGIQAPIKTINIDDAVTEEVYETLLDFLRNQSKK